MIKRSRKGKRGKDNLTEREREKGKYREIYVKHREKNREREKGKYREI